jgi:hypothetical protein
MVAVLARGPPAALLGTRDPAETSRRVHCPARSARMQPPSGLRLHPSAKEPSMPSHNSSRRFCPAIEALEQRDVPSVTLIGNETGGSWYAGSQHVYIFAETFNGSLNYNQASKAFYQGVQQAMAQDVSLDHPENVYAFTKSNRHLLIGWYDSDASQGGWLAADYAGQYQKLVPYGGFFDGGYRTETHTLTNWIRNDGAGARKYDGWVTANWTLPGAYEVSLSMVPTSLRSVDAYFTAPQDLPPE